MTAVPLWRITVLGEQHSITDSEAAELVPSRHGTPMVVRQQPFDDLSDHAQRVARRAGF
jgi:hypothetical protein